MSETVLGLILQNSISAKNFSDKFSSSILDKLPPKNNSYEISLVLRIILYIGIKGILKAL
jgi:hypothetical protein